MLQSWMKTNRSSLAGMIFSGAVSLALILLIVPQNLAVDVAEPFAGLEVIEEFQAPGRMEELSGIYPHPEETGQYLVVANRGPVYRQNASPKLAESHRGRLLTVDRDGRVLRSVELVDGDYGGVAYGDGHLFIASLEPAEILKFDPVAEKVVARFPIAGPAGGLEYDAERNAIYAQLFVGYPHLAVVDAASGAVIDTLWSDESAMGLAKVKGDLLCTWSNGFEKPAFSELRLLDQTSGKVLARQPLDGVHTSLAPTADGFLSLVSTGEGSGEVVVRRYAYTPVAR